MSRASATTTFPLDAAHTVSRASVPRSAANSLDETIDKNRLRMFPLAS